MHRGRGYPDHPSLPVAPHVRQPQYQGSQQHTAAAYQPQAAYPQFQYGVASHYAQAYLQHHPASQQQVWNDYAGGQAHGQQASSSQTRLPNPAAARWHQSGSVRCTDPGCRYMGSKKSVDIHMMDRHLVYPPGWETKKRNDEWDADPSLKGKPVPIQGTTIKLDTPEAIEQWIAERKKRFPTAERVADKKQKLAEAAARGQLAFTDHRFPNKKRRLDTDNKQPIRGGLGNQRRQQRNRGQAQCDPSRPVAARIPIPLPPKPQLIDPQPAALAAESDENSDSDAPPEVVSSKTRTNETWQAGDLVQPEPTQKGYELIPAKKPLPRQPRRPPVNPFASRPALLRNLLLPEIRNTVSNLSQAIRFLVDNEFLKDVEINPGQAEHRMIEVVSADGLNTPETESWVIYPPTVDNAIDAHGF